VEIFQQKQEEAVPPVGLMLSLIALTKRGRALANERVTEAGREGESQTQTLMVRKWMDDHQTPHQVEQVAQRLKGLKECWTERGTMALTEVQMQTPGETGASMTDSTLSEKLGRATPREDSRVVGVTQRRKVSKGEVLVLETNLTASGLKVARTRMRMKQQSKVAKARVPHHPTPFQAK
jgi:hypothetical protein